MTTYITYQCDKCKRTTELEVDPLRPTYDHCNITFKCTGRLKEIGTKSVRSQLLTAPVAGLTNWKPRTDVSQISTASPTLPPISITTGNNLLTVAVAGIDSSVNTLIMNCEVEQKTVTPFRQYIFASFNNAASMVSGPDTSPERKILRFSTDLPFPDKLKLTLNGVILNKGVRATGFANVVAGSVVSVTITQAGSGYDTPPTVQFGGAGNGAAGVATITDGKVTGVSLTASGINYTGTVPVSFTGGIQTKTLYYTGFNEFEFEPAIPVGSKLEIIVTPYVEPSTVQLTFKRHALGDVDGSWSNIATIKSTLTYDLFSCSSVGTLDDSVHFIPSNLVANSTEVPTSQWMFLASSDPHENVDRMYSIVLRPNDANLFKTANLLNKEDVLVDRTTLSSVFPPFTIVERLSPDSVKGEVSQLNNSPINNNYIIGLVQ